MLTPTVMEVSKEFISGEANVHTEVAGAHVIYRPKPEDRGFLTAPDWTDRSRHQPVVDWLLGRGAASPSRLG